jgi:hypothetical protein
MNVPIERDLRPIGFSFLSFKLLKGSSIGHERLMLHASCLRSCWPPAMELIRP